MAKSKLHPIAKKLGFKTNEEFYQMYPTKGHYEMAMGGVAKYPGGGAPTLPPYQIPGTIPPPEVAPQTGQTYYDPFQFQAAQTAYTDSLNKYNQGEAAWNKTKSTGKISPQGQVINPNPTTVPNYTAQGNAPVLRMNTYNPASNQNVDIYRYAQPVAPIFDSNARPRPRFSGKMGGVPPVFPQIQSEKGFFSRSYENVPSPYTNGSFSLGGPYAGFGEGHPFPYQPRMPKNGREAFGVPTRPTILAQSGGGIDEAVQNQNIYNSTMDAMGTYPTAPSNYRFPTVPGAYGEYYGGFDPNPWPPRYSTPADAPPLEFMEEEDPTIAIRRMGGSKKSCYNYGGSHKMHLGGNHKGTLAEFNQGSEYFTNKLNKFTEGLRNTATEATMSEMNQMIPPGYHQMPDGSLMADSEMSYNMGGGTGYQEMFPYAMPYQYADGGIYIKPSKRGTFTAAATKRGESVQGFASKVLANKESYSPAMVKKANFARNAAGWKKQEGGTPDPMKEAKWQAIIELTNQGITDPEEIAATLNNEGIYQTDPNEVAGYLQEYSQGQQPMKIGGVPKAQDGWDFTPDYRKSQKLSQLRTALEKKTGRAIPLSIPDEQIIKMGIDSSLISKGEVSNKSGYDPYGGNPYGNFMQGSAGYSGWPGGAYKVKNKFNIYGNPNDRFSAPQRAAIASAANTGIVDPAAAKALKDAGMWYKQDIKNDIWSRIGLARGPKRIHTEFGFGDQPNMGLPYDSGTGTTWAGDQLRKLTGPGKKKKARLAEEEEFNARMANRNSNAFMQPDQSTVDAAYSKDQAMRTSPAWQSQVQDPALIPWLEQTAQRLGVTPESLVNQQAPQTGPAPVVEAPTELTNDQLNENYRKAVEERDRIFKEHKINKRGRHRNVLGIKYQYGGGNQYINLPPPPSTDTMNLLKFDPSVYNTDPNMDPENLPGYVPQPTLSDSEMVQATEGNPADQFGSGVSGSSDFIRKKAGEADFWKDINAMNVVTNIANLPHEERLKKKAKFDNRIENRMSPEQYRDRGDYTTNYGYFRPDQQNVGNMVTGKFGGSYQEGGQYDLTEEEIQKLRDGGYDIEYI